MAAIPLHCNICPKKPNFSDVSHLLTHIASKGHLSNYYKVKVRSSSEDASRRLIEAYDRWYAEWNVEDLMSERMSQKDRRRTRARPSGMASSMHPAIQAPIPRPARPRAAVSNLLDPRLAEQQLIKIEATSPSPTQEPPRGLRHRPFHPRFQYWPTASRAGSIAYTNDYETSSDYSEASMRRGRYSYGVEDSCAVEDDPLDTPAPAAEDPMAVSESTKLKGVFWPGMDLFDSATPEMRRKRNQKKDSSVVEQLEINSQEVEATELIFTPRGSFKRQRRISSSVYDDEESIPPDSPRPVHGRAALGDINPNVLRQRHPNRHPTFTYPTFGHHDNEPTRAYHGHGDRATRTKRPFDIFQEDDPTFLQPSGFNYLNSGHPHRKASPPTTPGWPPYRSYNDVYAFDNKENIVPSYEGPAYDHHSRHGAHYNYASSYAYGLGHGLDGHVFQTGHHAYLNNPYSHQNHDEVDDQRTLTAPPSPSSA
ncbi:hypothetical protein M011DRAFT_409319 [Sporormia fimetaria CBS 119925]|uniref:Uncharacterized protein n=1 Tax=Sporormia fimetaria CBS 119925 TaxID=1340428 RepID=A0A6A6V2N9_9PLEO|nr:hypothetical protein M011DRAFT_409319 [Sporormia fimetaria CBS 119925]